MQRSIFIALVCLLLPLKSFSESCADCLKAYQQLLDLYKRYEEDDVYLKYSLTSSADGKPGETFISEMWRKGQKFRFSGSGILIIQDEKTRVMVSEAGKTVLIGSLGPDDEIPQQSFSGTAVDKDSMAKYTTSFECETSGKVKILRIRYTDGYASTYGIRYTEYEYEPSSGKILSGTYEILHEGEWITQTYKYLAFTTSSGDMLNADPVSVVLSPAGKLKDRYKGFLLRDLR